MLGYFRDVFLWLIASDLLISAKYFGGGNQYLNEIPMANYLDNLMAADDPIVSGYMFYTMKLDLLLKDGEESTLQDLSHFTRTTVNIFAVTENFKEISNDEFYIPTEVNGEPGIDFITGEKLDAHKALYEFEPDQPPATEHDPKGILNSFE